MDELFDSQDASQGLEPEVETSENSELQGEEIPKKRQEGTIENLQSKHDKFVKEVSQERDQWEQERAENREVLEKLQNQMQEFASPKKAAPLQKPVKPADFDTVDMFDPTTPSGQWFAANQQYQEAKEVTRDEQMQTLINEINQDRQIKQNQRIAETTKAETVKVFIEEGYTPQDALALYERMARAFKAPVKDGAKEFLEMFKTKTPPKKKDDVIPPGMDGAGSIPGDDEGKKFLDGVDGGGKRNVFDTK